MLYKVFVDDSGQKDFKNPYSREHTQNPPSHEDYRDFWMQNYFVLCGVRIKQEDIADIDNKINELKKEFFGTKDVEIKSTWLRNKDKRIKHYISKFSITESRLAEFGEQFIDIIPSNSGKLELISAVFDKRFYGDAKRKTGEGSPLLKCAQALLERIHRKGNYNVVVFDQMEDNLKKTRGNHSHILGIYQSNMGMSNSFVEKYDNITDIQFARSCKENFLQIADICAYNIYRQFVEHGLEWLGDKKDSDGNVKLSTYSYFKRIVCNFSYSSWNGKVAGVGLVLIPDIGKINWNFYKNCKR